MGIVIPFNHVIVEVHCLYGLVESQEDGTIPEYCRYGVKNPGFHCLKNNCPYVGHAPASHEIAFSGDNGEVENEDWIGFGGDMEPEIYSEIKDVELKELWKEVCKEKIQEAYAEYMLRSKLKEE
ncbi:hypothetical protein NST69_11495 [Paenibacillus sp. FSL P2-0089]|uniref:hypothetical protein n=1 Tax=Paenibacillus sp. FSL P2-0089 TaxID=2954526 RepID=UPI00315AA679